jgi:hypothetical protein
LRKRLKACCCHVRKCLGDILDALVKASDFSRTDGHRAIGNDFSPFQDDTFAVNAGEPKHG